MKGKNVGTVGQNRQDGRNEGIGERVRTIRSERTQRRFRSAWGNETGSWSAGDCRKGDTGIMR